MEMPISPDPAARNICQKNDVAALPHATKGEIASVLDLTLSETAACVGVLLAATNGSRVVTTRIGFNGHMV